jgi:hypothetical protein
MSYPRRRPNGAAPDRVRARARDSAVPRPTGGEAALEASHPNAESGPDLGAPAFGGARRRCRRRERNQTRKRSAARGIHCRSSGERLRGCVPGNHRAGHPTQCDHQDPGVPGAQSVPRRSDRGSGQRIPAAARAPGRGPGHRACEPGPGSVSQEAPAPCSDRVWRGWGASSIARSPW